MRDFGGNRRFDDDVVGAINMFASAALDAANWLPALERLAELTGSSHGQLLGVGNARNVPFNIVSDAPSGALQTFAEIDGASPLINPRIAASNRARVLELVAERQIAAVQAQLSNQVFADFAATHGIPFGCQASLVKDGDGLIGLAVLRSGRDGVTSEQQLNIFANVASYARMAVNVQIGLENEGGRLIAGSFEVMSAAAFVCDRDARVLARTPSTEALLSSGCLKIDSGRLRAGDGQEGGLLQAAIRHCADTPLHETAGSTAVVVRRPPPAGPLVLDVTRLPHSNASLRRSARILIVARKSERSLEVSCPVLIEAYDLTRTEAEIAVALLAGHSRQQIAANRGVAEGTVHTQIKSVFAKCGVSREAELVASLSRILSS